MRPTDHQPRKEHEPWRTARYWCRIFHPGGRGGAGVATLLWGVDDGARPAVEEMIWANITAFFHWEDGMRETSVVKHGIQTGDVETNRLAPHKRAEAENKIW